MSILEQVTTRLRRAKPQAAERRNLQSPYGAQKMQQTEIASWAQGHTSRDFHHNPVVYRCVRMIAEACASIPLGVRDGDVDCKVHPLLNVLARPNHLQSGVELRDTLVTHLLLHGNAYLERVNDEGDENQINSLYLLRPDRVRIICDAHGWPSHYEYQTSGQRIRHDATQKPCAIVHLRLTDPQDDHYGVSPLKAASLAISIHGAANNWNKSLFDNAARPSGALVYRGTDGQRLTDTQFDRLKKELQENFQGTRNAGRPLLLEGGLDWSSISMSPQDMDFIAAKHSAARDIALVFGVPPMLLGIPGDNSYANYAEANRAFWRQTVLPLNQRIMTALEGHLCDAPELSLVQSLDTVSALAEERRTLWKRIDGANFLTQDEKRALVGYAPMGDVT